MNKPRIGKYNRRIYLRLTEEQYQSLVRRCDTLNLSISGYFRKCSEEDVAFFDENLKRVLANLQLNGWKGKKH